MNHFNFTLFLSIISIVFLLFAWGSLGNKLTQGVTLALVIGSIISIAFLLTVGLSVLGGAFGWLLANLWATVSVLGGLFVVVGCIFLLTKFR